MFLIGLLVIKVYITVVPNMLDHTLNSVCWEPCRCMSLITSTTHAQIVYTIHTLDACSHIPGTVKCHRLLQQYNQVCVCVCVVSLKNGVSCGYEVCNDLLMTIIQALIVIATMLSQFFQHHSSIQNMKKHVLMITRK